MMGPTVYGWMSELGWTFNKAAESRASIGMSRPPPPPPGCSLGDNISFPIDVSSRAFRRARSDSCFPLTQIDERSVCIMDLSVNLCWKVGGEEACQKGNNSVSGIASADDTIHGGPSRSARVVEGFHDPHRTGYGRIPSKAVRVRVPPPCPYDRGILGVDPWRRTRGEIRGGLIPREQPGAVMEPIPHLVFTALGLEIETETGSI